MNRPARKVCGRHRDKIPESLERRGGGEDRLLASLADLPRHKARSEIWVNIVALVNIHPPHCHRRLARASPSFIGGSELPHSIALKVLELLGTRGPHEGGVEELAGQVVFAIWSLSTLMFKTSPMLFVNERTGTARETSPSCR